jgi:hypothetical protein
MQKRVRTLKQTTLPPTAWFAAAPTVCSSQMVRIWWTCVSVHLVLLAQSERTLAAAPRHFGGGGLFAFSD